MNLEIVFERINFFANYEKKNLKLLRAYFKTIKEENAQDMFHKTILAIIMAVVIWGINRGTLWRISSISGTGNELCSSYLTTLNYVTFIIEGVSLLAVFIFDYYKNKKRNHIVSEIIEVCIDEIE